MSRQFEMMESQVSHESAYSTLTARTTTIGLLNNPTHVVQVQIQMFYYPNRHKWCDVQYVCSSFLWGGGVEQHSLSSCPPKYKTQTHEYCKLSIYHSRILHDAENSKKCRKRNFANTMNSENNISYLALPGEPWGVPSEFFVRNTQWDIESALYFELKHRELLWPDHTFAIGQQVSSVDNTICF